MDGLLEKIKFLVAAWVSVLPRSHDISIGTITECWKEIAFPWSKGNSANPPWSPTLLIMVKLNCDGSFISNPGMDGAGGIICDSDFRCLISYSGPAGVCTV